MADNIDITPGTGKTVATDEVVRNSITEHEQIIKISLGAEGAHDLLVDSGQQVMSSSVPVVIASDQSTIPVGYKDSSTTTGTLTVTDSGSSLNTNALGQDILTGTPTAGSTVSKTLTGETAVNIQLDGTFNQLLSFEKSIDGGTTWVRVKVNTASVSSSFTSSNSYSDNKPYVLFANLGGGATNFRVRCEARTSGTANVTIKAGYGAPTIGTFQLGANYAVTVSSGNLSVTTLKPDGTNTMPSLDTAARAGFLKITDGTLSVGAVDETGTSAVDAVAVGGGTPHDSVNSGNPLLVGNEAIAHGTNPTAVAAGDRTKAYANRAGVPFVIGGHPNIQTVRLQFTAAQTDVAVITVSTGTKIVVTSFQVTLDNASTIFPSVRLGFGTANTPTTTQVIGAHGGLPAGGGFGRGDGSGIIGVGADNEDLRITTVGAATGNGVEVVVSYFTIES